MRTYPLPRLCRDLHRVTKNKTPQEESRPVAISVSTKAFIEPSSLMTAHRHRYCRESLENRMSIDSVHINVVQSSRLRTKKAFRTQMRVQWLRWLQWRDSEKANEKNNTHRFENLVITLSKRETGFYARLPCKRVLSTLSICSSRKLGTIMQTWHCINNKQSGKTETTFSYAP